MVSVGKKILNIKFDTDPDSRTIIMETIAKRMFKGIFLLLRFAVNAIAKTKITLIKIPAASRGEIVKTIKAVKKYEIKTINRDSDFLNFSLQIFRKIVKYISISKTEKNKIYKSVPSQLLHNILGQH
jgi:hypothetical protein